MPKATQRSGVMLYFDVIPSLDRMDVVQKGTLFEAILRYARDGIDPVITDPTIGVAWDFIKPRIDADGKNYDEKRKKSKYAAYCRIHKLNYKDYPYELWLEEHGSDVETVTDVNGRCFETTDDKNKQRPSPTTTTTSTSDSESASTTATTSDSESTSATDSNLYIGKERNKESFSAPSREEVFSFGESIGYKAEKIEKFFSMCQEKNWEGEESWKLHMQRWKDSEYTRSKQPPRNPEFQPGEHERQSIAAMRRLQKELAGDP